MLKLIQTSSLETIYPKREQLMINPLDNFTVLKGERFSYQIAFCDPDASNYFKTYTVSVKSDLDVTVYSEELVPATPTMKATDGNYTHTEPFLCPDVLKKTNSVVEWIEDEEDFTEDNEEFTDSADEDADDEEASEEEFKFSDLGKIFTSKMFWLVALLCVLYYSAIFPFQRYAPDFLNKTLDITSGAQLFSCFPILAMVLTPFLGGFIDRKGKAASMLMIGSLIMIACHLSFAFVLPMFPSKALAVAIIAILGVSFSLVPAALWPSVPKIIDERILGSAYCVIFWIQNWGLLLVPIVIGKVLDATGGYTLPMVIFSSFGVVALLIGMLLKREDKKKGYGMELPNIKE